MQPCCAVETLLQTRDGIFHIYIYRFMSMRVGSTSTQKYTVLLDIVQGPVEHSSESKLAGPCLQQDQQFNAFISLCLAPSPPLSLALSLYLSLPLSLSLSVFSLLSLSLFPSFFVCVSLDGQTSMWHQQTKTEGDIRAPNECYDSVS